jgi:4-diphosphocytidyl-2-C-methyl-D-erythritol kinase
MPSALAPAKINLYLCVLGRREDGFHAIDSLIVPLAFGDTLELEAHAGDGDQLDCDDASLRTPDNLVLRGLAAFRERFPEAPFFKVHLQKKIPAGAGLGGGSSDAATVMLLANGICGNPLNSYQLSEMATEIGSDCAVFLQPRATFVSGRGEIPSPAGEPLLRALEGRSLVVFKPPFSIATPWAYRCLSQRKSFSEVSVVAALRKGWQSLSSADRVDSSLLHNDFELAMSERHLSLRVLLAELRQSLQSPILMSGSGSAFFVLEPDDTDKKRLLKMLYAAFGEGFFWVETMLKGNNTCSNNTSPYYQ